MGEVIYVAVLLVLVSAQLSSARIAVVRPCTYDQDCDGNAYCKNNRECQCRENFFIYRDAADRYNERCLSVVSTVEGACEVDDQCQITLGTAAECVLGTCQCRQGARFSPERNRCFNTSRVGGSCQTNDNCYVGPDVPLTCKRSVCVCPRLMHPNANGTTCLRSTALGEGCSTDEQCVVYNSRCDSVCRCGNAHIANTNNTICLKAAVVVGDSCVEEVQCSLLIKDATCKQTKCVCIDDFHPGLTQNRCWRNVWLNEPCVNSNECLSSLNNTVSATCSDGLCICQPGQRPEGLYCVAEDASSRLQPGLAVLVAVAAAVASGRL